MWPRRCRQKNSLAQGLTSAASGGVYCGPRHLARLGGPLPRFIGMRLQSLPPVLERQHVVLAQRLDIAHLQACLLRGLKDDMDRLQLAVGKDIALRELLTTDFALPAAQGDAVIEEYTVWPKQRVKRAGCRASGSQTEPSQARTAKSRRPYLLNTSARKAKLARAAEEAAVAADIVMAVTGWAGNWLAPSGAEHLHGLLGLSATFAD